MTQTPQKPSPKSDPAAGRAKPPTLAALKQAAREQLLSKGISGASVQTILDRAGVSRGALFHHFPTKNHLIAAAFDDLMRYAAARLQVLGAELRLGLIDEAGFVRGLREVFASDLFIGSMEIALANRVDPAMGALIADSVEAWWTDLNTFWTETFELPGLSPEASQQHWVMAANLLRGHAFTTIYRSSDAITDAFCASFRQMILGAARRRPLQDSFARLEADLARAVGHRLFTALAVLPEEVERVHSTHPDAYPLTGRKRLVASPWWAHVVEAGQPWLGHDRADLRAMFPDYATIQSLGCGSCINMPVTAGGRVIGSLNLLDAPQAYSDEHVARTALFTRRAAALFQQAAMGAAPQTPAQD